MVPSLVELVAEKLDVVYGGPPCQGFSQIGPRDLHDPRNRLYEESVRVVQLLQPKAFVMENVPNMVAMKKAISRRRSCRRSRPPAIGGQQSCLCSHPNSVCRKTAAGFSPSA